MTTSYRQYSDQERAVAIAYAEAAGWPDKLGAVAEAERKTGIKRQLITRWLNGESHAPDEKLVQRTKLNMVELIDAELQGIFDSMAEKREDASYGTLSIAAGILLDKKLALAGIGTDNHRLVIEYEISGYDSLPNHAPKAIETKYQVEGEQDSEADDNAVGG